MKKQRVQCSRIFTVISFPSVSILKILLFLSRRRFLPGNPLAVIGFARWSNIHVCFCFRTHPSLKHLDEEVSWRFVNLEFFYRASRSSMFFATTTSISTLWLGKSCNCITDRSLNLQQTTATTTATTSLLCVVLLSPPVVAATRLCHTQSHTG